MRKLSRTLFKLLLPILILFCLTTFASADGGVIAEADFNNGAMHWSISTDGVLTITGNGDMPDNDSPWNIYNSEIVSVVVDEGITRIGVNAFNGLYMLESVSLPGTLTELGAYSFAYCDSLSAIDIPAGVAAIDDCAFYECASLREVSIPEGVIDIGSNAFCGCRSLAEIDLPEGLTTIGNLAFCMCSSLVEINIPAGVTNIGNEAFENSGLERVFLPSSLERIGGNAFYQCPIEKVYYAGSRSSWNGIVIYGNEEFTDAKIIYEATYGNAVAVDAVEPVNGSVIIDDYYIAGETVTVIAMPDPGYSLKTIIVNGVPIEGGSFVAEEGVDYVVSVEFEFYMDVKDSGSCGTNLTWTLYENSELVISGTGEMFDGYYNSNAPWYNYRAIIKSVVINEGVTSVGSGAFQNCTALTSVELPDSLEYTGSNAFAGCSSLKSIELPAGLKSVGSFIFNNCNIDSLYYAGDVEDWLKISFPNYEFLGNVDFLYISGELIENLVIPDGTMSIPDYAFTGYDKLKTVVMPATVSEIGDGAFNCYNLVYAEFLGDAPSIGADAFNTDRYNDNGFVIYYHENTSGWSSPIWDVYYAACVEDFSDYSVLDEDNRNSQGVLFTLNESAKTAVVGDGSNNSNNSGYYGAQRGAVVIPDAVTKNGTIYNVIGIGPNAFSGNRHVTSVSIGTGVTSILPSAFTGCPELESITVSEENEYYRSIDGVLYDAGALYLYVYPGGKADESFTVPETVQTIGSNAFYDNEHIRTLTVGRNVTAIYDEAFCGLTNLSEITLPFIGTRESLEDVYYYDGVFGTVFGDGTYGLNSLRDWNGTERVGSLKEVTILGGELYEGSFSRCTYVEEINLPSIPSAIPEYCFSGCTSLKKLTFAGSECKIGNLVLPEGIGSIGRNAFDGCTGITSVTLPTSLTSIESSVFSGAGVEEFAVVSGNLHYSTDEWGVLYNYDKTTLIQYPSCRVWPYYNVADTTTSIATNAFSGCSTLVNLYIPNTVTSINTNFRDCSYLTICCYTNSTAYRYAHNNGLTAWYMDNKTLQGISVYSLPEQTVQTEGAVNLAGLYIVGDYGGRELQIDDYTLSYDDQTSGLKTVTVEYMGKTATFEMVFYTTEAGNIISFRTDEDLDGVMVMISLYNSDGAMIYCGNAAISNGEAQIGVSDDVYDAADHAKLLILDESNYTPAAAAQEISV